MQCVTESHRGRHREFGTLHRGDVTQARDSLVTNGARYFARVIEVHVGHDDSGASRSELTHAGGANARSPTDDECRHAFEHGIRCWIVRHLGRPCYAVLGFGGAM